MGVPAAGLWVLINWSTGVQESEAATLARTFGIWAWQSAPTETVTAAGVFRMAGGVVSTTVKRTVQTELLPDKSATVMVTGCEPSPTRVPARGDWVIVRLWLGVQLSVAVTCETKLGTAAWQL